MWKLNGAGGIWFCVVKITRRIDLQPHGKLMEMLRYLVIAVETFVEIGFTGAFGSRLKDRLPTMISFEGGQIAKRKVFLSELVYTDPGETSTIRSVLTQLTEARLIARR